MAAPTRADLLEAFRQMTVLELADFVRQFEETFGVSATPSAPAPAPPAEETEAEQETVQDEFDVVLEAVGTQPGQKLQVIKTVRALTRLGLKEAKDLVDAAPSVVLVKAAPDVAEAARAALTGAGGTVVLK
jgi:large subunit ribosomal protein L7/L12